MSQQFAHIPRPVAPGAIYPTDQGRWIFSIVAAGQSLLIGDVHYYSAGMAQQAMQDLVAKIQAEPAPRPKLGVVQGGGA